MRTFEITPHYSSSEPQVVGCSLKTWAVVHEHLTQTPEGHLSETPAGRLSEPPTGHLSKPT